MKVWGRGWEGIHESCVALYITQKLHLKDYQALAGLE